MSLHPIVALLISWIFNRFPWTEANWRLLRQVRMSSSDFSHSEVRTAESACTSMLRQMSDNRATKRKRSIDGKRRTIVACRKDFRAGTYMSLQMQMIGLQRPSFVLVFFFAGLVLASPFRSLTKYSTVFAGAPSISSMIRHFGRFTCPEINP